MSENLVSEKKLLDDLLVHRSSHGYEIPEPDSMLFQLPHLPVTSLQDQISLLCSIPNYHWWDYKLGKGGSKSKKTHVRYSQHLLFHPQMKYTDSGTLRSQYLPVSPRNQVIYFSINHNSKRLATTLRQLYTFDRKEVFEEVLIVPSTEDQPPPPKRKRQAARLLKLSPQTLCEKMNLEFSELENSTHIEKTLFRDFKHSLSSKNSLGTILWRMHSSTQDVVIMSNYHLETGVLLPSDFVHVTSSTDDEGTLYLQCSCKIYQRMKCLALQTVELENDEEAVMDSSSSCMHCRFFKEELHGKYDSIEEDPLQSFQFTKIGNNLQFVNKKVAVLNTPNPKGTTKFSVGGEGPLDYSFVHITTIQNVQYVKCMKGLCQLHLRNKKKMPKVVQMDKMEELCPHLHTFFQDFDYVRGLFPEPSNPTEETGADGEEQGHLDEEDTVPSNPPQPPDFDPEDQELGEQPDPPQSKENVYFDKETGMWCNQAFTKHKPKERFDPALALCRRKRLSQVAWDDLDQDTGCFPGPDLIPLATNAEGGPLACHCGVSNRTQFQKLCKYLEIVRSKISRIVQKLRNRVIWESCRT